MQARQIKYRAGHDGYVSEFTNFIGEILHSHPELVDDQRRGWAIFWDRRVDLDELKKAREDSVPVKPYYYS